MCLFVLGCAHPTSAFRENFQTVNALLVVCAGQHVTSHDTQDAAELHRWGGNDDRALLSV